MILWEALQYLVKLCQILEILGEMSTITYPYPFIHGIDSYIYIDIPIRIDSYIYMYNRRNGMDGSISIEIDVSQ